MNLQLSKNTRSSALLFGISILASGCLTHLAPAQAAIVANQPQSPPGEIDRVSFRQDIVQFSPNNADEKFKREQLNDNSSSTTISNVKNVDGWSQPIGWLFGLAFVILALLVAWSKYNRNQ